ncbi:EAL domain-containing protein [Pseudomonas sp. hsmgli-8]|uniref:EAL domain-containing protein n=1 Tax=Pseudomonas quercus TaxID=2722792 RepID=A0ABX0YN97_9PSED|nr:EAL domain-containing protein [Pseudomonas quercus]NJP03566.1 EAL domain-containing protein [Pseudomonas quercus]
MPDAPSSQRFRRRLYPLLAFYLLTLFAVSVLWEFKLEGTAMAVLGLPYDGDFETAERWRFVLTSTGFALLSMVVPIMLLHRLLQQLRRSYFDLLSAQTQSDALARYDSLSGLLNRRVFNEQLIDLLAQPQPTAVFLIDLDHFKSINDSNGHAAGDAAICVVAERLRAATQGWQACVARLGGDEFAIAITGDFGRAELSLLAEDILKQMSKPIAKWPAISLSATLGIAISPADGLTPELLLQRADRAMYRGKHGSRAVFHFYEASFEAEQREQALFEQELRQAIQDNQIQPFYQPVVKLPEQSLAGFEILARWPHPTRGLIMPLTFIAIAEQLELIKALTQSLLLQAFTHTRAWPDNLMLAINVSSSMIEDPAFPEWLKDLADEGDFPLERLEIEVTESMLVANVDSARLNLETLRTMGVSVALDDFGTGYSGLYHLTQLSIDKIKIDRSFLDCALENQNEMVKAILALGKSLSMQITAEGVEHDRVAEWLAKQGCDLAQGYLFGQPLPALRVDQVLQHANASDRVRY